MAAVHSLTIHTECCKLWWSAKSLNILLVKVMC